MALNTLEKFYRRYFYFESLHKRLKAVYGFLVDVYAQMKSFHFPEGCARGYRHNMIFGKYEKEMVDFFRANIKPGMVVVDAGAHIGYFTRLFSDLVGPTDRVYAFEAHPVNYSLHVKNTKNHCNVSNFQIALTDQSGQMDFY